MLLRISYSESVLEKTLMLYTKANRATNAFLSAAYPTASQENESESASVPGSVHSSCTSLVGSEASRHITGQSSDSSESECLSDPPPVKTSLCQSRKLCRTLSSDPCRRKTTPLRDSRPSGGSSRQNYSQPQTVLDRSISPLSSVNTSNSRSNLHATGYFIINKHTYVGVHYINVIVTCLIKILYSFATPLIIVFNQAAGQCMPSFLELPLCGCLCVHPQGY